MAQESLSTLIESAIKEAIARLIEQGRDISPSLVGAIAAGIAGALGNFETPLDKPVRGVRFLTGNSPALGFQIPAKSVPKVPTGSPAGTDPDGPSPGPQPIAPGTPPVQPGMPQPISPGRPPVQPGMPQPIGPGRPPVQPGMPQPIGPGRPPVQPGMPQPIGPGRPPVQPGIPQPISPAPGGQPLDPDRIRQLFGVLVFEGVFRQEVASHLSAMAQTGRISMTPLRNVRDGSEFRFLAMDPVPEYVKTVFNPLLRDLIEFAADRFGMNPPKEYSAEMQFRAAPVMGGSVPYADVGEPGGQARRLTWIYFVPSNEPYSGGELVLYETAHRSHLLRRLTRRIKILAEPNTMILYPSELVYEVTPVVAQHTHGAIRPTIQGWLSWES